jgi:hypothetical protein
VQRGPGLFKSGRDGGNSLREQAKKPPPHEPPRRPQSQRGRKISDNGLE